MTTIYLVMEEREDWGFDGETSVCTAYWVPIKAYMLEEQAKEHIAPHKTGYKIEPVELE